MEEVFLGIKQEWKNLVKILMSLARSSPSKGKLGGVGGQSYESILLCEKARFDVYIDRNCWSWSVRNSS